MLRGRNQAERLPCFGLPDGDGEMRSMISTKQFWQSPAGPNQMATQGKQGSRSA